MKKLIEKQGNYVAYLKGVIRALRDMSGIEATFMNTEAEQKYESEITALKNEQPEKSDCYFERDRNK